MLNQSKVRNEDELRKSNKQNLKLEDDENDIERKEERERERCIRFVSKMRPNSQQKRVVDAVEMCTKSLKNVVISSKQIWSSPTTGVDSRLMEIIQNMKCNRERR